MFDFANSTMCKYYNASAPLYCTKSYCTCNAPYTQCEYRRLNWILKMYLYSLKAKALRFRIQLFAYFICTFFLKYRMKNFYFLALYGLYGCTIVKFPIIWQYFIFSITGLAGFFEKEAGQKSSGIKEIYLRYGKKYLYYVYYCM